MKKIRAATDATDEETRNKSYTSCVKDWMVLTVSSKGSVGARSRSSSNKGSETAEGSDDIELVCTDNVVLLTRTFLFSSTATG